MRLYCISYSSLLIFGFYNLTQNLKYPSYADLFALARNVKKNVRAPFAATSCVRGPLQLAGDESVGEKSRTFVFQDEGHTLGNALRSIISQYPEVSFCGYTVPHPAETKMHFRIQTKSGRAVDILRRGLEDLERACEHTTRAFENAWESYQQRSDASMDTT